MMKYRSAKYNSDGSIDCEIEHPKYGWIPFTASEGDPEKHGRDIFALIVEGGNIAEYTPPDLAEVLAEKRANTRIPRAKFASAAAKAQIITDEEAEEWAAGASIPQWVSDAIEAAVVAGYIPEDDRLDVRIAARTQITIGRMDRLIPILAEAKDLPPEQVDALFGVEA